jgi:hypothetical protein
MRGNAAQKSPQWGDFRRNSAAQAKANLRCAATPRKNRPSGAILGETPQRKRRHAVSGHLLFICTHKPRSADKSLFASFSQKSFCFFFFRKRRLLAALENPLRPNGSRADDFCRSR